MSDTKLNIARPKTLGQNKLQADRLARPDMFAVIPNEVTFEDLMTPAFWANHVAQFTRHPYGEVTCIREDGSLIVKLIAMQASPGMVRMHCLYAHESGANLLEGQKAALDDKLEVPDGYKPFNIAQGENKGWSVRLQSTGEVIIARKPTRREAILAAQAHAALANSPIKSVTTPPQGAEPAKQPETV
jgi:hypothetical protein